MIGAIGTINGYKLFENSDMGTYQQFRFCKSKKERIRKKWRNNKANYRFVPSKKVVLIDHNIIAHPTLIRKIIQMKDLDKIEIQSTSRMPSLELPSFEFQNELPESRMRFLCGSSFQYKPLYAVMLNGIT